MSIITRLPGLVWVVSVFAALGHVPDLRAGQGVFSKDGKTVTFTQTFMRHGLFQADIATGKVTEIKLSKELIEEDSPVESLVRGADGETLILVHDTIWAVKPAGGGVKRVCGTAPVTGANGLFAGTLPGRPYTDWLFVSGVDKEQDGENGRDHFYARQPGAKNAFRSIFCRRVENAECGTFTADGRFFFASSGDLWEGDIQVDEGGPEGEGILGVLVGARMAPVATLNTDSGNGGGMWVGQIATAGKWVYVLLHGRHMAELLRVPMTAKPLYASESDDLPGVKEHHAAMGQALAKTEIIADGMEEVFGLCATEVEGKPRVFFCLRHELMLWEGKGEPREIGVMPPEKE